MRRIAFITVGDTSRRTGGYLYHARLFQGLREKGVEVVEITPCGATPEEQLKASPKLDYAFDPERFDVILVDALACVLVSPWLDRWRRRRPVVSLVHELPSVAGSGDPEAEEPLLRADRLVTVSDHGRTVLEERGAPPGRISVVSPGFDRLRTGDDRTRSSLQGGATRVLCVAQWIERKGILPLVKAWGARERRGAVLELIGETDVEPDYSRAVRAAIERSTGSRITVAGPVDDATLSRAYSSADIFVLLSSYEGYGVVYAEALSYGLPVVACDVGPIPELVGEEAALLITPDDAAALDKALDILLEDPALRARMSAAALRRARKLPRWGDTIDGFYQASLMAAGERGRVE